MQFSKEELDLPIEIVRFMLFESSNDKVSLSWHLTNREKERIRSTFENEVNQKALLKLDGIIKKSR